MIKKYCVIMLVISLAAVNLTACKDKGNNESNDDTARISSSSYFSVNYTDIGDDSSSRSNVSENVDRSQSESKTSSVHAAHEPEKGSSSSVNNTYESLMSSSVTVSDVTHKTTVTYYFTDDEGEQHTTDIETDVSSDTNDSDDYSRAASESKTSSVEEEQVPTDSDVQSEISENTDTAGEADSDTDDTQEAPGYFTEDDTVFYYNGSPIMLGENIDYVVAAIGEPEDIKQYTADNAPEVTNKEYFYEGFSIEVGLSDDSSAYTVTTINIFDRSLTTERGVHIDMNIEDVIKIYGQEYQTADNEYRYYSGDKYLFLGVQNDVVSDLGYRFDDSTADDELN